MLDLGKRALRNNFPRKRFIQTPLFLRNKTEKLDPHTQRLHENK